MTERLPVLRATDAGALPAPVRTGPRGQPDYTLAEMVKIAELLAASGYYSDVKQQSQAFAKILRGSELGVGPATALSEISIVEGKPTLSANLMAALIKRSGKYNYRVASLDDEVCEIEFFEHGEPVGTACFTLDDAKRAGLAGKRNWTAYGEDMLFARAMSRGARRFCADVLGGTVYVQGELEPEYPAPLPRDPEHVVDTPAGRVDMETGEFLPPVGEPPALPPAAAPSVAAAGPILDRKKLHERYRAAKARADDLGVQLPIEPGGLKGLSDTEIAAVIEVLEATVRGAEEQLEAAEPVP